MPDLHDLPPRWDGHPIDWDGRWQPRAAPLHAHLRQETGCEQCGSDAPELHQRGRYNSYGLRLAHSPLPRRPKVTELLAARCPDCQHTTVIDLMTQDVWELAPSDYTDAGSYNRD